MMKNLKEYSPILIRISISLVFLWFGLTNVFNPNYLLGYLPQFISFIPIQPLTLMLINGIFEIFFGTLLLIGFFTRFASIILTINLIPIIIGLGYNDIAIRDIGLALVTLSIFLHGPDKWCLDYK